MLSWYYTVVISSDDQGRRSRYGQYGWSRTTFSG